MGKGQLLYLILLWVIIIFNFEKALGGFTESRLATEGVLFVNAVIVTFMINCFAREREETAVPLESPVDYSPTFKRSLIAMIAAVTFATFAFTGIVRMIYGDHFAGHAGYHQRFGAEAEWRLRPLLRDVKHR